MRRPHELFILVAVGLMGCDGPSQAVDSGDITTPDSLGPDAASEVVAEGNCCCGCADGVLVKFGDPSICRDSVVPPTCDLNCESFCEPPTVPPCGNAFPYVDVRLMLRVPRTVETNDSEYLHVEGVVEALGDGRDPSNLLATDFQSVGLSFGSNETGGYWIHLKDPSGSLNLVEVLLPGAKKPALGDRLVVRAWRKHESFMPDQAGFVMSKYTGAPLVALVEAGTLSELEALPNITFSNGNATCFMTGECGSWVARELSVDRWGNTAVVHPGTHAVVDLVTVSAVALVTQTTSEYCPDWFVDHAMVGVAW